MPWECVAAYITLGQSFFLSAPRQVGKRVGELGLSTRCQRTAAGIGASALWVTKMRPADVAAQRVPWSTLLRASHDIDPPVRSGPYTVPVRSPSWLAPWGPPSGW